MKKAFIDCMENMMIYDDTFKMISFYDFNHREFIMDFDAEKYMPIDANYLHKELIDFISCNDNNQCKKIFQFKKDVKQIILNNNNRFNKMKKQLKEYQIVIDSINQYLNQSEKEDNPEAFLYGIECVLEFMNMRKKEKDI